MGWGSDIRVCFPDGRDMVVEGTQEEIAAKISLAQADETMVVVSERFVGGVGSIAPYQYRESRFDPVEGIILRGVND